MKFFFCKILFLLILPFFVPDRVSGQFIDSVKNYIELLEIKHPEIVLRQAVLETGWFKSRFLMSKNNLFGFTIKKRYSRFSNWKSSVEYYKKWQDEHYTNPRENYYHFLARIKYARSPNYIATLKKIHFKKSVP